ncbi:hypothetical protein H9P43_002677 [Blastocladiella emersonii ATCC 22665]|nr:hypothetical protein H9P43_002677 [Blastocladiella emersonii ATCC 22665]
MSFSNFYSKASSVFTAPTPPPAVCTENDGAKTSAALAAAKTNAPAATASNGPSVKVVLPTGPPASPTRVASANTRTAGGAGGSGFSAPLPPARAAAHSAALPPRNQNRALLSPMFPSVSSAQRVSSTTSTSARKKVALEPGHSPLDWARLKSSGEDLRQTGAARIRLTMEEVAKHKTVDDAWTVLHGNVYNMTAYLKFHPGGIKQIMRGAGRDSTKMFMAIHSWVNIEYTLDACLLGPLEPSSNPPPAAPASDSDAGSDSD